MRLESEAEEEDQVQTQISDEEEADIVVGDEPEGDANAAADDTNVDTDATTDEVVPIPWKEIQEYSVMFDLSLIDSEDGCSSDEDYTEDLADTELTCAGGRFRTTTESSLMRNIDVVFRVPIGEGFEFKELDEFPIAFVKEMTRKFNKDFLRKPRHRTQYRKMMNEVNDADTCVFSLLDAPHPPEPEEPKSALVLGSREWYQEQYDIAERGGDQQEKPREIYSTRACPCCYEEKRLCARFIRSDKLEPRLVIYPLGVAEINGGDWQSMGFWVRRLPLVWRDGQMSS
ncbi:uncharacterized protein J4E92_004863 [Alternaria infectoria]|uniref:uncharacterized protein n=1 Tax=Alternaria infectoria TaxID=45303 RepID=UPI0022205FDA|nr:uncharacterized protein J4E92_004863 [Alternaria infectoria]KAI4931029.1 hypothetical protein J4E92_004863 [Alternaria infectoria]